MMKTFLRTGRVGDLELSRNANRICSRETISSEMRPEPTKCLSISLNAATPQISPENTDEVMRKSLSYLASVCKSGKPDSCYQGIP